MTPVSAPGGTLARLPRGPELLLPVAVVASILVILVPLPPALMDVLLAANISISIITLLTVIYVLTPLEFSIFPTLLLTLTLGRLVLNVATTRLVLTRAASDGLDAAGHVVRAFGTFVAGDDLVVGMVMFGIILVIQFVVITKGSTRISEVAARFALDSLPGRQMAVDADVNAGLIDQREAQARRGEISRQADFYGAMDGASKFIRGDAVAGLVITVINIVGGFCIGVFEQGLPIGEASSLYTKLTIGDGLVSQLPALLVSLAAGLLVTRSSHATDLPREFIRQMLYRPQAIAVTGVFLALLVFTDLPRLPLMGIAASCFGLAYLLTRRQDAAALKQAAEQATRRDSGDDVENQLAVTAMELELGVGLIRLADPQRGGDLLDRIGRVRQSLAADLGIVLPKIRIRDNLRLEQNRYCIRLAEAPLAEGTLLPGRLLAIETPQSTGALQGLPTNDPATNRPALWIDEADRERAAAAGYVVVDPAGALAAHLREVVDHHADELLTRDATKYLVARLKEASPAVVEELIPGQLKLGEVQQVLQHLLREQVPIRQLATILEALGDRAPHTKDPAALAEFVRGRLARVISTRYRDRQGKLLALLVDPELEDQLRGSEAPDAEGAHQRLPPRVRERICGAVSEYLERFLAASRPPIVLTSSDVRAALRTATAIRLPRLIVLSYDEITADTTVETLGTVSAKAIEEPGEAYTYQAA
ncbi:MAG: flagellar biosynthesis protein FlhA [Pirellulales bacterium]|nr:flagellar biosynthesis protein FlhA [Pirellulales bacterium]